MVKVLVLGAAGYIGSATALALQRAGHRVVGVGRQKGGIPELEQNEVETVEGDISDLKSIQSHIDAADVIIDNVLDMAKGIDVNVGLFKAIQASAKQTGGKKRYIYTSGCLVYGDQPGKVLSESDALKPQPMLKQRVEFEQAVTKSTNADVDGMVIRPGFVYGGKSNGLSMWFTPNKEGQWVIDGSPKKQWGWVHIQDLAQLYVLATEAASSVVRGEIFNANDATRITYAEARTLFARAAGFTGEMTPVKRGDDFFSQIMDASTQTTSAKACKLLGWRPALGPLQDHAQTIYKAWKANQAAKPSKQH